MPKIGKVISRLEKRKYSGAMSHGKPNPTPTFPNELLKAEFKK
jgi:hypothetical protein